MPLISTWGMMINSIAPVYKPALDLYSISPKGEINFNFHKYQKKAMKSPKRFILLLAGTQGGKTSFASPWLLREIRKEGPGDYLFVAPTFKLMQLKAIPEFLKLFETLLDLGEWRKGDKVFTFSANGERKIFGDVQSVPTRILFGHAQDPDSLESATAKAAVLDECGQKKFKLGSFEAIMRRLSLHMGRVLMTTTPYYLGWLKKKFWDAWEAANRNHPEIDLIRFPSTANPAFPMAEYERAREELPRWKFNMFYNAIFERPAGLIYDCFDETTHKIKRFPIPDDWPRFMGVDFGGVNTAGVYWAKDPNSDRYFAYREYKAGGRTASQHAEQMCKREPHTPTAYGGAASEGQWREEFSAGGLPIFKPYIADVEVGINRVYGGFKTNKLYVFDDLDGLIDEIESYSRELDDEGEPTEKIEDKNTYHYLDATRYIMTHLMAGSGDLVLW